VNVGEERISIPSITLQFYVDVVYRLEGHRSRCSKDLIPVRNTTVEARARVSTPATRTMSSWGQAPPLQVLEPLRSAVEMLTAPSAARPVPRLSATAPLTFGAGQVFLGEDD
jgi:hypothetical protein